MPKPLFELRKFIGGMVRDLLRRDIPKTKYYTAENINLTPNSVSNYGGASVSLGSEFAVNLGLINFGAPSDDYQAWGVKLDLTAASIVHDFTYYNGVLQSGSISSTEPTPTLRYNDLVSQLNMLLPMWGNSGEVYISATPINGIVTIGIRVYGYSATVTETITSVAQEVIILKEFYGNDNGFFVPLKSIYIDTDLFILSTNGTVTRLGVAKKDYITGAWTYTVLLQTNQIQISQNAVVDMDGQIDFGERVSIYFTAEGYEPRCFYVKRQSTWVANSAMIYYDSLTENTDGYYIYNTIDSETQLQILQNFARATLNSVSNTGGALKTGNKQYYIRQLAGEETASGVGLGSAFVSIYTFPDTDNNLYGQVGGVTSTKLVSLNVTGLNPLLYDKFQLIVVENTDGVLTGSIVNTFDITGTDMTVLHSGAESGVVSFDLSQLATQQILIKSAGNLVIARNRLFISNIETQVDYDLYDWARTITIETKRSDLPAIGEITDNVAEYQLPSNIYDMTGYMLNELYRFGIRLFFKNGFVSSAYFIGDHRIGSDITDSALTDGGTSAPTVIYVYSPQFTVDLLAGSPTVDGIPLKDAIWGYAIERCDCIPEILATGYIMPAAHETIPDYYTTGGNVVTGTTYTETSTSSRRNQCSFVSPDILFGVSDFTPVGGDIIYNYGQVESYNFVSTAPNSDRTLLYEFSCANTISSPVQHIIQDAEMVPFNTDGSVQILGAKLRNLVTYTFSGVKPELMGNNQKSIAIELSDYINPMTGATDIGFYYAQYFRPIVNKYGEPNEGEYKSCGHFTVVGSSTTYTDVVFGGDTFTQKNFIKHCNLYSQEITNPAVLILRVGLSYYTQNRGNYQLRNFTTGTSSDYPYTTQNLRLWANTTNPLESGQLNYSVGYSPIQPQTAYITAFDQDAPLDTTETNILYYSDLKVNDSLNDPYRIFLPINRKAYPAKYGAITNTFLKDVNWLVIMMNEQVLLQRLDQQQVFVDGTATIIGDGTVLGAQEQPISNIGSPIKTGAMQYKNSAGQIHVIWYSPYYKKLLRLSNGVLDIGEATNNQSLLTGNNSLVLQNNQIVLGYDFTNDEVLITTNCEIADASEYSSLSTYNQGDIVWIENVVNQRIYYIAQINVPADKSPLELANKVQYWDDFRDSNYTLIFNDKIGQIACFDSFKPLRYLPFNETFLTQAITGTPSESSLFEHNKGLLLYDEEEVIASITMVFNEMPDIYKAFRTLYFDIKEKPLYVKVKTADYVTYTDFADINFARPHWAANVYNDATISVSNPNGLNTLKTAQPADNIVEVTVWFKSTDINGVNNIRYGIMKMLPRPKYFNN